MLFDIKGASSWDAHLNNIHTTGYLTANQVQNLGVSVLTDTVPIDQPWNVPFLINREFRDHLKLTLPYIDLYNDFLTAIAIGGEEAIEILVQCDQNVIDDVIAEAAEDLTRARNCVSN